MKLEKGLVCLLVGSPSNWGRRGDEEIGAPNVLTGQEILAETQRVRQGLANSLQVRMASPARDPILGAGRPGRADVQRITPGHKSTCTGSRAARSRSSTARARQCIRSPLSDHQADRWSRLRT